MYMSKTSLKTTVEWKDLNWRKLERMVFKLQKRIYKASSRGDVKTVRRLQKTLIKSWAAKALAVKKVSQDNKGKKTAGIDGIKSLNPAQRLKLAENLRITGKSKPTRRVWIPKPKTDEKRPLGIPTMYDRALQSLVKLALEPEWEAFFEPNSYGFRPGRSCHDAIQQLFLELQKCPKYILDADIAKCFDRINHQELLKKLNTYPTLRHQIKAWLKSGVMDNGVFEETETGTPQGGVISPLLANIALHGMEEHIRKVAGRPYKSHEQPHLVRYADDLVILHKEINVIYKCQEALEQWLSPMGLELKPSKTRICHSLNKFNGEKAGFDFLGFNICQYPTGKAKSLKANRKILGFTLTIKPNKEKVKLHLMKLKQVIKGLKSAPQSKLIKELNPIIKGWCNYYSTVVSKETFAYCEYMLWQKLRAWAKRRHTKKNVQLLSNKYWKPINGRQCFTTREKDGYTLFNHANTPIKRFVKVQNSKNPYDGDWAYWSSRLGKNPQIPQKVATLLKKQKGKCAYCNNLFSTEDLMEIDHIIPKSKGGKNTLDNLQLLHRHCHDSKTAMDLKADRCFNENDYPIEERNEVKVSRSVLKTSRSGDASA